MAIPTLLQRRRRRAAIAGTTLIATISLLTACTGAASTQSSSSSNGGKPVAGGTLTVAGLGGAPSADLSWLAPAYNVGNEGLSLLIQGSLFDSPAQTGGAPVPDLATGYTYKDNNTVLDIKLRSGVKFTDGTPLNAAAIVWLWGPTFDGNPASKAATYLSEVSSVKALDSLDVEVTFKTPDTLFVQALDQEAVGFVASPTAFKKEGANGFDQNPVGAGAYMLKTHVPNQSITIVKNPNYWDAKHVYLNQINQVLTGTDPTANYQALQSGRIDLLTNLNVFGSDAETIQQALANKQFKHESEAGVNLGFVDFTTGAPFNNKLAREALYYCTNPQPIAKNTLDGFAEPAYVWAGTSTQERFYPTDSSGKPSVSAAKKLDPYQYNPTKAKQIVQQLGGLSFTLTSNAGNAITTAVQQEWAQCGINVKISLPPSAQQVAELEQGQYQAYITDTVGVSDPRLFAKYLTSSETQDQQGEVNDPVITNAFNASIGDTGAQLQKDWTTIFTQVDDDAYLLPVVAANNYVVFSPCIHGMQSFGNVMTYLHAWTSCS